MISQHLQQTMDYALIPAICMLVGGVIASIYQPKAKLSSAVQHFAAGVVFAAVAVELIPKLIGSHATQNIAFGFAVGVLMMLVVKRISHTLEHRSSVASKIPFSMLFAIAIDVFIDGLLIGIAFLVGEKGGVLIAVALAIEILFLGLSCVTTLRNNAVSLYKTTATLFVLALLIPSGAFLGATIFSHLPKGSMTTIIAFGVAALLYLVTEELLTEAHEVDDTPWITAMFFLGFLFIFLLETQS